MSNLILGRLLAEQLHAMAANREWSGTITELAEKLSHAPVAEALSSARLGIWLRRHEPTLWWDYGVRVRFSRTSQQRFVHLSRREENVAWALT